MAVSSTMNVDRAAPLSLLEDLTPKILQHIASYLVRDNTHMQFDIPKIRNQVPVINDALLEFRATSKTINVKTEYSYIKMFESHGTESDPEKVSHLLQISRHTKLAPAVRHLLFTPSGYDKTCLDRSVNWSQNFSHDPKIRSLQGTMSPMKVALVGALKNFSNLNSVSVSWNIDSWFWEESEGILASMVFAAVVSARIPLEMLDLRFPRYECRGGIPTSKFTGLAGAVSHFQNLKVLGLVICHHQHANLAQSDAGENGLKIFIQNLPFLEQLSLKMDYGVDLPVDIAANTTHLFGTLLSPSTIVQLF